MIAPLHPPRLACRLHVALAESQPLIWRRVLVPHDCTLKRLHQILQVVMGWTNSHLHQFIVGDDRYAEPHPEYERPMLDHARHRLDRVAPRCGDRFRYVYDFGDNWKHDIEVEWIGESPHPVPACIAGERACPPEDCGGLDGFYDKLRLAANRSLPDPNHIRAWLGPYDPEAFDLAAVNRRLGKFRRRA